MKGGCDGMKGGCDGMKGVCDYEVWVRGHGDRA